MSYYRRLYKIRYQSAKQERVRFREISVPVLFLATIYPRGKGGFIKRIFTKKDPSRVGHLSQLQIISEHNILYLRHILLCR